MEKSEKECGTDESIIARLRGTERQMEAKERELRQAVKDEEEIAEWNCALECGIM